MLSEKMTFSLTSLILILVLAFVAPFAMADNNIGSALVMDNDIGHADGLQVQHPGAADGAPATPITDGDLVVTLRFDKAVDLAHGNLTISILDEDGAFLLKGTGVAAADRDTAGEFSVGDASGEDLRERMVTIEVPPTARSVKIRVAEGVASTDPFEDNATKKVDHTVTLLAADPTAGPDIYKIALVGEPFSPITTETFQVHILLSEEPNGGFNKDLLQLTDLDFGSMVKLATPVAANVPAIPAVDRNGDGDMTDDGEAEIAAGAAAATWRDGDLHLYLVTLKTKPDEKKSAAIQIKDFASMTRPTEVGGAQEMYIQRDGEGRDKLTLHTKRPATPAAIKTAGIAVDLPHGDAPEIPADGYFLLVRDNGVSGILISGAGDENDNTKQTPAQLKYNSRPGGSVNLETFLASGGTIDLTTTTGAAKGDVVISEIMWGSDAANADSWKSQWIELHNTTASKIVIGEKQWTLRFYGANEALPTSGYIDRVGTRDETNGIFWAPKGSSGRTDVAPATGDKPVLAAPTVPLISMQRASSATGYADGTLANSWSASALPATNFVAGAEGQRIGTPGAAPVTLTQPTPEPPPPAPAPVTPAATASDIAITEIMVDTGGGRLPQWIELTNTSSAAVSLADWNVVIDNAADADVYGGGAPVTVSIGDVELGVGEGVGNGDGQGQSVLLVAWSARNSGNFNAGRVVNLATQLEQTGRYQLLSYNGFRITLVPKQTSPVLASGDDVGNLGMNWDIPMGEDGRSSLIRMEMDAAGMATMGTSADGWRLASATDLVLGPTSWYGSDEDAGTPGYDSGGPLPVELSMFYPARDRLSGAVVITWETQSELNNAGFFIKRSEARNGKFVVINPTMVPGAGTTSEKQSYTYTDTSAKPNVVYYYQIEDVSLDGQRQTLTLGTRLRGHIGAAGKLTTSWGELKKVQE